MWVTPDVIDAEQFTHRRLRGGYDETEVDDFLDLVAGHVGEMQDYIDRLEAELDELRGSQEVLSVRQEDALQPVPGRSVAAPVPPLLSGGQAGVGPDRGSDVDPPIPVGRYAELAPDRLDVVNGGRPHDVPRPERAPEATAILPHTEATSVDRAGTPGPGHQDITDDDGMPYCPVCDCWHHRDGHPDRLCSQRPALAPALPAFVPARTLADEIAEDAERYLHDETRRAEARRESSTWRTAMELERAEWCRRVGLDANPIEWSTA